MHSLGKPCQAVFPRNRDGPAIAVRGGRALHAWIILDQALARLARIKHGGWNSIALGQAWYTLARILDCKCYEAALRILGKR